jgi:hypothetical protein
MHTNGQNEQNHEGEAIHGGGATRAAVYTGGCFCGAVQVRVTGQPEAMGYCHCSSCRLWSAGPVNAFTLWKPQAVEVTRGRDRLGSFQKTALSNRRFCTSCGGHLFTEHEPWGLIDVYAAVIPQLAFKPQLHVNYGESVLRLADGLPKQRDLPSEMGGTGVLVTE